MHSLGYSWVQRRLFGQVSSGQCPSSCTTDCSPGLRSHLRVSWLKEPDVREILRTVTVVLRAVYSLEEYKRIYGRAVGIPRGLEDRGTGDLRLQVPTSAQI